MAKFEIGKKYEWYQNEYGCIKVLRRTPKCIVVEGEDGNTWRMVVKTNADGDEYVIDSVVPYKWRDAFTCSAKWIVD